MAGAPTPHIAATPEQFARTVLMPGDPQRSAFIAETFLEHPVLVNNVRGVQGYTGTYRGEPVSVMASGMGMPSMGIYSYELFRYFDVENLLRVGSAGALTEQVQLRDLVLAMGVCTDSAWATQYHLPGTFAPIADYELLSACVGTAKELGIAHLVGNVVSSDVFYADAEARTPEETQAAAWGKMGVLAVEMETAALYMNAARLGKRALGMFTVSDHLLTGEGLTVEERRSSFTAMLRLALETAIKL